jgi:hypothetical protein
VVIAFVLLYESQTRLHVPSPLEAHDCPGQPPHDELARDRFVRKGGRTTRYVKVWHEGEALTTENVAEDRDLSRYDKLVLADPVPRPVVEKWHDDQLFAQARTFLWEHWRDKRPAYLILTLHSVDSMGTAHIFMEQDDFHRWRIYERLVHWKEVDDTPTNYSMSWVHPGAWDKPGIPLASGQVPDPLRDKLEFRDICGEVDGFF